MIRLHYGKDYSYVHITGHCNCDQWPKLAMAQVWEIFCRRIKENTRHGGAQVNAFVLMHNHFHLLITEKISEIERVTQSLSQNVTKDFESFLGEETLLFEQALEYSLIDDFKYLKYTYRYIYQNPVKAGIVEKAEQYKFSSLYYLLGQRSELKPLAVADTFGIIFDPIRILHWINDLRPSVDFLSGGLGSIASSQDRCQK